MGGKADTLLLINLRRHEEFLNRIFFGRKKSSIHLEYLSEFERKYSHIHLSEWFFILPTLFHQLATYAIRRGFPDSSVVKNLLASAGDVGSIPG